MILKDSFGYFAKFGGATYDVSREVWGIYSGKRKETN